MSMQSTDSIADMLTRIRNAIAVGKGEVRIPHSKQKETIAKELSSSGYLYKVTIEAGSPRSTLVLIINAPGTNPTITEIHRISTPGRRQYAGAADIPKVKSGRGIILISTSRGVMTGQEAKKQRLGGELICSVY